ncbi:MAG: hypothetical protein WBL45_06755 [Solirubrobacterales bacterium]
MIGRRSTIGLSLLCALAFCAFAAQSASAVHAKNTTAFTCIWAGPGNGEFADPHCDEKVGLGNGPYHHKEIPPLPVETTELEVTNETTEEATEPLKLNSVVAGVGMEVLCKKAASAAKTTYLHNVDIEGNHTVTGTILINVTECEVKKPTNCKIKEPIVITATFEGVEGLGKGKDERGLEFKGEGKEGEFATLNFSGEKCAFAGKAFPIQGSAIGTGQPGPKEEWSGSTAKFETGPESNTMESLVIGKSPVEFTGGFTTRMAGGGNPISLTTVT